MELRLEYGSTDFRGISRFGTENFLFYECGIFPFLERRISIFKFKLFDVLVGNLHFLCTKCWVAYLEQFLSPKFTFSERRISIFNAQNFDF